MKLILGLELHLVLGLELVFVLMLVLKVRVSFMVDVGAFWGLENTLKSGIYFCKVRCC